MMRRCHYLILIITFFVTPVFQPLAAQMGFDLNIKKPNPYGERVLRAEKTPVDKNIKFPKRFFQNLSTRYNYYFNANNKLNEVIARAKQMHKDDYSSLLSFYNYSFDVTAADSQLDSVQYKSKTGIVMHDLRSDWADNMYMLWGASYYFKKQFDSASLMFQFINYAFAEKEKDGYYKYIGSRMDGNNALSISTKENTTLLKKVFSTSPSRNDAFLWQIRSQIELEHLTEAGSLIATLKNDPNFPQRLNNDLEEIQAYWFYKQEIWDSSAFHLLKGLDVAKTKQEKARWEYLAAQMLEKNGNLQEAQKLYTKAIGHGTDPILDVYARLNLVRTNTEGGENYIDENIADLLKMAKKSKYQEYRDVIYFMAAEMEMKKGNFTAAQDLFQKAAKYNNGNLTKGNNAFLMIADLAYSQKKYLQAAAFYDSVQTRDLKEEELKRVVERKASLKKLVFHSFVVTRQDSLQRIAALPEEERKAFINNLVKNLRRQKGLLEESASGGLTGGSGYTPPATDLFNTAPKSEWYFNNANLKTQGAAQFKQIWGNRPNVDNWRWVALLANKFDAKQVTISTLDANGNTVGTTAVSTTTSPDEELSTAALTSKLPLTPQAIQVSNDSIKNALFTLGNVYLNDLEDYPSAIETFEKLRARFPDFYRMDEVAFSLFHSYQKIGEAGKTAEMKNLLSEKYPSSRFTSIATTGKDPEAKVKGSDKATKDYEAVYDMYLEGHFDEAQAAKKKADSIYKTNYWQPQLLYIEAVYNIKQRNDSNAKTILNTLIAQNASSPIADKAKTLLDVLSRRKQIEDELSQLQIERPKDDTARIVENKVVPPPVEKPKDTVVIAEKKVPPMDEPTLPLAKRDTTISKTATPTVSSVPQRPTVEPSSKKPIVTPEEKVSSTYSFTPSLKHFAVVVLDKVDPIFSGETRNAFYRYNREKYYNQNLPVTSTNLDTDHKLILIGEFDNAQLALEYVEQAKPLAPTEIVPWLKADKYSFLILSTDNLEILQNLKDLKQYKSFLEQNLPGKF